MINVAIDEFRKNKKYEENNELLDDLGWSKLSNEANEIDENAVLETEEYWNLIRGIPDPAGTVFNLFVVDDFGHKEIAERLKISERSSKRYLRQAREWLLNKIKKNHVSVKQYG
jgi:DNA-directed RNA polymerase specialized sigma24 family protein